MFATAEKSGTQSNPLPTRHNSSELSVSRRVSYFCSTRQKRQNTNALPEKRQAGRKPSIEQTNHLYRVIAYFKWQKCARTRAIITQRRGSNNGKIDR